jgi:hypothetical protein
MGISPGDEGGDRGGTRSWVRFGMDKSRGEQIPNDIAGLKGLCSSYLTSSKTRV